MVTNCDIIIDGKFESSLVDTERNLVGSTNQQIHFVSDRYKQAKNYFLKRRPVRAEINVYEDIIFNGDVTITEMTREVTI
ncbi:MAG: hypothetical protein ATN35_11950 [Epulopiscium sp. Nele67-Bin004]|nr:MAG: hypothetical protein ATN35_11950 [Epulopiscium sp. Nele67-Bin004]